MTQHSTDLHEAYTRIARERVAWYAENERQRRLILQIIDAGTRAMALKLHPDAGGSHDAMSRLTVCKERLRKDYARMPRLGRTLRTAVNRVMKQPKP
jgi:hypothetical protein